MSWYMKLSEESMIALLQRDIDPDSFKAAVGRYFSYKPFTSDRYTFRFYFYSHRRGQAERTIEAMERNGLIPLEIVWQDRKRPGDDGPFILWQFPEWLSSDDVETFIDEQISYYSTGKEPKVNKKGKPRKKYFPEER